MNFAEAMMEMFKKCGTVVICDSIIKMSEEREPNFGTEIIGYAKLKTKGVCRITVDTCGETWGKFRLCDIMCFDDMDMADETWRVVTIKERREDILRRYPKEWNQDRDVSVIRKERQERIKLRQIVSLEEVQFAIMDMVNYINWEEEVQFAIMDMVNYINWEIDWERAISSRMGDPLFYSDDYDPDMEEPIPVAAQLRNNRIKTLEQIKESKQFTTLSDICDRLCGTDKEA